MANIGRNKNAIFSTNTFFVFADSSYQKIFVVTQLRRRCLTRIAAKKRVAIKKVTIKSSHKNKQLLVKIKTTSAGIHFHYIFRRESFSFIENELLHSFLVFFRF